MSRRQYRVRSRNAYATAKQKMPASIAATRIATYWPSSPRMKLEIAETEQISNHLPSAFRNDGTGRLFATFGCGGSENSFGAAYGFVTVDVAVCKYFRTSNSRSFCGRRRAGSKLLPLIFAMTQKATTGRNGTYVKLLTFNCPQFHVLTIGLWLSWSMGQ